MNTEKKVIGLLAHVDSGKTTLAEALLYRAGVVQSLGRVDHRDAYLDTHALEKGRGITIFSKQAECKLGGHDIVLMDTPGHIDFSSEMERTLRILDYAILIISAPTGISGHTLTLWKLLKKYNIPCFIFVNKMDQIGMVQEHLEERIQNKLDTNCICFSERKDETFYEKVAMTSEEAMELFLNNETIEDKEIIEYIKERKIFPIYFGSALHLQGIEELIDGLSEYTETIEYGDDFGATVFKISRDEHGNRLTHLKILGGTFKVRTLMKKYSISGSLMWEDKVNQIRIYSGNSYVNTQEASKGMVCAVTGLTESKVGQGLGNTPDMDLPSLEPVMVYQLIFKDDINIHHVFAKLKEYEEEEPSLEFDINAKSKSIQAKVMGQVQIEVIQALIKERFGLEVSFTDSMIIFKETIKEQAIGIGHFEPLKHYAEVHLLLEPIASGSGVVLENKCVSEGLPINWQNLVMAHLREIVHTGVRIGSELTDVRITLIAGAGHEKHTEGGDFREATYRALKQALMQVEGRILEPMYTFEIEVPIEHIGRVISDMTLMNGDFDSPEIEGNTARIKGTAPVRGMAKYPQELLTFTKGFGQCYLENGGYSECLDSDSIIEKSDYSIYEEGIFTPDSVFCKQGVGYKVPWNQVIEYAHVDNGRLTRSSNVEQECIHNEYREQELWIDQEEIDEIINRANTNSGKKKIPYKRKLKEPIRVASGEYQYRPTAKKKEYLLVDGYNIIFAWDELKELAQNNLESASGRLLDILSNYQGVKKNNIIVVFDAYKVKGNEENTKQYHNISVVYTKEAESADGYIERVTHGLVKGSDVVVATSDVVEQLIVMGQGARKMSASQLAEEVAFVEKEIRQEYLEQQKKEKIQTIGEFIQNNEEIKIQEEQ